MSFAYIQVPGITTEWTWYGAVWNRYNCLLWVLNSAKKMLHLLRKMPVENLPWKVSNLYKK